MANEMNQTGDSQQYNPMTPIKRGYKLWCMADQKGYIMNFKVYQGRPVARSTIQEGQIEL